MSLAAFHDLQAGLAPRPRSSRRAVLQAALASAGGLLSLTRQVRAQAARPLPRIVVIGAGFAGLACADELAQVGFPVRIAEARNRVGGRVVTHRDIVPGKTVEGGGELIGPNQPTWMAYAKRFGLSFVELPWNPSDTIVLQGQPLPPPTARALWNEMREALARLNPLAKSIDALRPWLSADAKQIDAQSLDDWIRGLDVDDRVKQLIAIQMTGINGLIPAWQSLLGILAIVRGGGLQKFWDETDTLHCVGGAQQLAIKLQQSFVARCGNEACQLNLPVEAIRRRRDHWQVSFADGRTWEADEIVLTAPPSTWSKIAFEPTLPPELSIPMAVSTKYIAVADRAVWQTLGREPNAMSSGPIQLTWETTAGQGALGQHALVAYAGGAAADEIRGLDPAAREATIRAQLETFYPGYAQAMRGGRFLDWMADPWARGSYSFPAPGQVTTVGPLLDRGLPHGLHFAGEYACYAFTGWMEGALASGVGVARKIAERSGVVEPRGK
ncbi:MAG: FAD-dependent oxidoreductase [Planctomycetaceae bacterium]|nr:FAD-dependent oxidoreductase [Planctomycetaceae bacterium]